MDKNGTYVDAQCNEQKAFVCKADFFDFTPGWDYFLDKVGKKYDCPEGWKSKLVLITEIISLTILSGWNSLCKVLL